MACPRISVWSPSFDPTRGGIEALSAGVLQACRSSGRVRPVSLLAPGEDVSLRAKWLFCLRCLMDCCTGRPGIVVLMHLHFVPLAAFLKRIFRFRLAVWIHGIEAWDHPARRRIPGVGNADVFIAISGITKTRTAGWRDAGIPLVIIHPSVDFQVFSPGGRRGDLLSRYGLSPSSEILLTVGRLAPGECYKGHDAVIRALPTVLASRPDAVYLIVGSGDDRSRLEALSRKVGVREKVIFAGRVSAEELPDHYRLATVFAMPSGGEGFGIVYLEALGCGCRVVAGKGDGASDALDGGRWGTMVDPEDIPALAGALAGALAAGRNDIAFQELEKSFGRLRFEGEISTCLKMLTKPCAE